jgi:polyisoprenyl-teichoic acid--peptidoglycan teichoic acid transferase
MMLPDRPINFLRKSLNSLKAGWAELKVWQRVGLVVACLVVGGAAALISFGYFSYKQVFVGGSKQVGNTTTSPTPAATPKPPVYTVALFGHGGAGHEGALLTDSIMVIRVDTGARQIALISVPRDIWVGLPSNGEEMSFWKINAAYAIGYSDRSYPRKPERFTAKANGSEAAAGGALSKYALEKILGFPVDNFVAVDFAGFQQAVDVIGGVDVFVDRPFEDPFYPIPGEEDNTCGISEADIATMIATLSAAKLEQAFPCRFENLKFERGKNHFDGETALKFARSRHAPLDGGDFNRAARQRKIFLAVRDRIIAIDFIPKIIPFINKIAAHVKTDIPLDQLQTWLGQYQEFQKYEFVGVALTSDKDNVLELTTSANGQSILLPRVRSAEDDWSAVHTWIQETLASASAKQAAAQQKVASGSADQINLQN